MKTTGNYDWVVATWVKQEQAEGGTPYVKGGAIAFLNGASTHEGRRMFFKGDTIYSYHEWWPMAKILPGKLALTNHEDKCYSSTTRGHTNMVESELQRAGYTYFEVERSYENGMYTLKPVPDYLLKEFQELYNKTARMRDAIVGSEWWTPIDNLKAARTKYFTFCDTFGFKPAWDISAEQWRAIDDRVKEYKRRIEVKRFARKLLTGVEA